MLSFIALSHTLAATPPPTVSGSLRAGTHHTPHAGTELRLDSAAFVRVRTSAFAGANADLHAIVAQRAAEVGEEPSPPTNWLARTGSIELAAAPLPSLRLGVVLDSTKTFTRRGLSYLVDNGLRPDTLGLTRGGPLLGVGTTRDGFQIFVTGRYALPIRASTLDDGRSITDDNGLAYRGRAFHGAHSSATVEARVDLTANWVLDLEVGVSTNGRSPVARANNLPGNNVVTPTLGVAFGWRGLASKAAASAPDSGRRVGKSAPIQ